MLAACMRPLTMLAPAAIAADPINPLREIMIFPFPLVTGFAA
jgi:hypothetical protein